jgi:hypothetical protein
MLNEENAVPLTPIGFIQLQMECRYLPPNKFPSFTKKNKDKYLLPNTSSLCAEGLELLTQINTAITNVIYPEVTKGDSVEIFIDTRDVKTSGFNTKFCHHFFFLPEAIEGQMAGEVTRFRTEDAHELCNPKDLQVEMKSGWRSYSLNIFIPSHCLHGYDPEQYNRLGFSYRVNRAGGKPQHFSVVTGEYQVEQQPSLWSSLRLIK